MSTLQALIFDFDGVIANTEPLHYAGLHQTLKEIGIELTEAEYYADYLGYDDRGCILAALAANHRPADAAVVGRLMKRKAEAYLESVRHHQVIFPGVPKFVHEAAHAYPLAIASGALRHEIEYILDTAGLRPAFLHITSAEDVTRGKPDPQPFLLALKALQQRDAGLIAGLVPGDRRFTAWSTRCTSRRHEGVGSDKHAHRSGPARGSCHHEKPPRDRSHRAAHSSMAGRMRGR